MNSLQNMGMTMGEFAEQLMNSGMVKPSKGNAVPNPPQGPLYEQKDISKVEVPDSFMKQILGEKYTPQSKPNKVIQKPQNKIQEESVAKPVQLLNEQKMDELLNLLRDVKELLTEMSCAGGMGVNLSKPEPKKTKSAALKYALKKRSK